MSTTAATRRVLVRSAGDVSVGEAEPLPLRADDVRIAIAYAGICGSDLHLIHAADAYGPLAPEQAGRFGHEYSGVVQEVGSEVGTVAVGDRVTCAPRWPCLHCAMCRRGDTTRCLDLRRPERGAWAEQIVVPERIVFRLPEDVELRTAALCEPLACALRGVDRVTTPSGHVALVIGGGPIGLLTAALAARTGAREVLLSEPHPTRRALARRLGAHGLDPRDGDLAAAVAERTDGLGPDVVYESVGRAETVAEGIELAAPGGTVVVLGVAPPEAVAAVRPWRLFERELAVVAAWGLETTFRRALDWLSVLDLEPLVTHVLPLEEAGQAIDVAASGDCGKVMLTAGAAA
ncbi:MAG: zinc-dependent alcohol dehydrogenase [Conexibacter sp.]